MTADHPRRPIRAILLSSVLTVLLLTGGRACQKDRGPDEQFESARQTLRDVMAEKQAKQRISDGWTHRGWRYYASWSGASFRFGRGTVDPDEVRFDNADYVRIDKRPDEWFFRVIVGFGAEHAPIWLRADNRIKAERLVEALEVMGADVGAAGKS